MNSSWSGWGGGRLVKGALTITPSPLGNNFSLSVKAITTEPLWLGISFFGIQIQCDHSEAVFEYQGKIIKWHILRYLYFCILVFQ